MEDAEVALVDALSWLKSRGERRFFLYVHLNDPLRVESAERYRKKNEGKRPSRQVDGRVGSKRRPAEEARARSDPYDAAVRYVDGAIGTFVLGLHDAGLFDETLLVVTADHGMNLAERGDGGSDVQYPGVPDIPVIVSAFPRRLRERPARPIDVAPLIVSLLGYDAPERFEGRRFGSQQTSSTSSPHPTYPTLFQELDRETCLKICSLGYSLGEPEDCMKHPPRADQKRRWLDAGPLPNSPCVPQQRALLQ